MKNDETTQAVQMPADEVELMNEIREACRKFNDILDRAEKSQMAIAMFNLAFMPVDKRARSLIRRTSLTLVGMDPKCFRGDKD